ncbi:PAS domain-containing sensor histidine kinase [Pseudodesulfovibrio sp.]|uniref:sensor histidine kinase n=1 Tax=Pseudodesulfovibrio sp. TaxID=2035812 RepID=UPI002632F035|nr:PAS domain-containing sensor histidine kinase [Pseudodesulfovibrio sp.]MDD3312941.1 ATP-binding protein [Pseudodesulfovibrio sp.]
MSEAPYYQGLAKSMMFTIALVSLAPLLGYALLSGYQYTTAYKEKVEAHLRELVLKHDQSVDSYLREKVAEVQVLGEVVGGDRLKAEAEITSLHNALVRSHGSDFVDLGIVNAAGVQVAYAGPYPLQGADYSNAEWFQAVKRRRVFVSDVIFGLRGVPHFIIALLVDVGGEQWVLKATLDFMAINDLVEDIRIGETGLAFITNRAAQFQTTPRRDMTGEVKLLHNILARGGEDSILGRGRAAITVVDDPVTGREVLFVTSPLKDGEWFMVYQQDTADAFAALYRIRNVGVAVLLLGTVCILAMAFLLSRRMARKVEVADQEKDMMNDQVVEAGKLASVGELAAGIAHEINNPVAIMVEEAGWVQDLLEEGLQKDDNEREVQRALTQIRSQGARCREITHKLLSFARKIDPTVERMCVNDLIREMAQFCEQRAKYANVRIETSLEDGVPQVEASQSEMQQVLLNLINNAIDAMDPGGGELDIMSRAEGGDVFISISDTGCGIPKANLQRIFDPFFTTKPVGKGTGLGLSIIYGIINKMGGDISVKSVVNKGTAFTIRLPASKEGMRCAAGNGAAGEQPPADGGRSEETGG